MKKILFTLLILFIFCLPLEGAPPSRSYTYNTGEIIDPDEVTTNENNLYEYLQSGVDYLASDTVSSSNITDGTIVAGDIATGGVATAEILDGTIIAGDIATSAVTTTEILDDTIATADIAEEAITTTEIKDLTVATGDIAANAITTAKIASGTIVNFDIAESSIYPSKMFGSLVTTHIGSFTRAMDAASDDIPVTGLGFQPSKVIFMGSKGSTFAASWGFDDASTAKVLYETETVSVFANANTKSLFLVEASGKRQEGYVKSMDSDGFTIAWTRVGATASATATIAFMAFK